jgi:polyphosphate kinase
VLVELKARFDEESNIEWARSLEREGVLVVYGLVGLKVHSKIAMVVRREGKVIRRYVHLGTGNYNPATARLYTDLSLFTCDEEIGADASELFNRLTGYAVEQPLHKLLVAPDNIASELERMIRREIAFARAGEPARLIFKTNALEDLAIIKLLYEASGAGVKIDLLVRGICCLRPGLPGVSSNIRVTSIVGRFLEHSRIFYFRNGGREEIYAGSADLMPRNLHRRVEILFPVKSPALLRRLRDEVLGGYLADTANARHMQPDGTYEWTPRSANQSAENSQARFISQYGPVPVVRSDASHADD